jgi:hypothetical protein
LIASLVACALIVAAGWPLASLLDPTSPAARRLGESWLLGAGVAAGLLMIVPWSRMFVIGALLLVALLGAIAARKALIARANLRIEAAMPIDLITLVMVAGYARFATIAPPAEIDFIGIWGLKAREFWIARGIDWRFLENPFNTFAHPDYPVLVPLLFDVHAVIAGAWPERWLGVVNVGFGVATLLILRAALSEEIATDWLRRTATLALAPLALSPWIGLAECAMVGYGTAAALRLRSAVRHSSVRDALHGAIYLGLAANSKNEGLTFIVAAAVALLVTSPRLVVHLWPAAAIASPWIALRFVHHLQSDYLSGYQLRDFFTTLTTLAHNPVGKPLFWIGAIVALLAGARSLGRERFLVVTIGAQLLFFVAAYLVTPHDVAWHVRWSWERITAQITPLIGFLALVAIAPLRQRPLAAAG